MHPDPVPASWGSIATTKRCGPLGGRVAPGMARIVLQRRMLSQRVYKATGLGRQNAALLPTTLDNLAEHYRTHRDEEVVPFDLAGLLKSRELFAKGLRRLQMQPGNYLPRVNPDHMSRVLDDIIHQVLRGDFKFMPHNLRDTYVPHPFGKRRKETDPPPARILLPPIMRDLLVCESVAIVLETIFEPRFLDLSHGFRPKLSRHTALRATQDREFQDGSWMISGNLCQHLSSLSHDRIMSILESIIPDRVFTTIIREFLRAGLFEFRDVSKHSISDTPLPSNGLAPVLLNILLHHFDVFIVSLKDEFDLGQRRCLNPKFTLLRVYKTRLTKARASPDVIEAVAERMRRLPYLNTKDPAFRRLNYVRHADQFLISIIGAVDQAKLVQKRAIEFLYGALGLSTVDVPTDIVRLVHSQSNGVVFLGTHLQRHCVKGNVCEIRYLCRTAPILQVRQKIKDAGFVYKEFDPCPFFHWGHFTLEKIVMAYGEVYNRLARYYAEASNRHAFRSYMYWMLRSSCAKLFAAKLKLSSQRKVFLRYTGALVVNPSIPNCRFVMKLVLRDEDDDPLMDPDTESAFYLDGRRITVVPDALLRRFCQLCGSMRKSEVHLRPTTFFSASAREARIQRMRRGRQPSHPSLTFYPRWDNIAICNGCHAKYVYSIVNHDDYDSGSC